MRTRLVGVTLVASLCGCSFLADFDGLTGGRDACPSPTGASGAWTLTFDDEFDGTALDTTRWNDHLWFATGDSVVNYAVSGGTLKIWPDQGFVERNLDTDGKFSQTQGFFEMRAKLPIGKGVGAEFWMLNHDDLADVKDRPEIDVMTAYPGAGPGSGWSDAAFHPTAFGVRLVPRDTETGEEKHDTGDLSSAFHRYGAKWTGTDVTYYFDGAPMKTIAGSPEKPLYLIITLGFPPTSGAPDATTPTGAGNAFEIDYVRAWKSGGSGCGG